MPKGAAVRVHFLRPQVPSAVQLEGFRCDCGKKFKTVRSKQLHRMKGCGNPPTFYCPYDECGYKFTEYMFLGFHLTGFHLKMTAAEL
ncbi:hypothetical protein HUJ04_008540 [Dendroctonus ponderosae]|nr:hypothetical protein HUJ04_008540 [Dendroctonus ponderosae]KAH1008448.1 hypothetical protein HUJ05_009002 [Dendroctonus ponderosae]